MTGDTFPSHSVQVHGDRIRLIANATFDDATLASVFADFYRKVAAMQESGPVRALIDLRSVDLQPFAIISMISRQATALYRDGDRVAIMTPTTLLKVQLRRILPPDRFGIFVSPGAADHFLDRDEEAAIAIAW